MFRRLLGLIWGLIWALSVQAQANFTIFTDTVSAFPNLAALQSFALAQHNGLWPLVSVRTDGLHHPLPFAAFKPDQANANLWVVDPKNWQVWSSDLSSLSTDIAEQLQSTNAQFVQRGNYLYLVGGYGYSTSAEKFVSYPYLTAIDVANIIPAIKDQTANLAPFFRQTPPDTLMAVCGGQMGIINNVFYLVGGHRFDGRYTHSKAGQGSVFFQTYTNAVRRFTIDDDGINLTITYDTPWTDELHLHRRDFNLVPQIFPDGSSGFTLFSGVFQPQKIGDQEHVNMPYLYPVDITANAYTPQPGFNQYLSQYHSAKIALFDSVANQMHTLFFGGMSQFEFNTDNELTQNDSVPFVKTISQITRAANGELTELNLPITMPGLLGTNAEFIPAPNIENALDQQGIIQIHKLTADTVLLGYIIGGITSPKRNPFLLFATEETAASAQVHRVYMHKMPYTGGVQPLPATTTNRANVMTLMALPNQLPKGSLQPVKVQTNLPEAGYISFVWQNELGQIVRIDKQGERPAGLHDFLLDAKNLASGKYVLSVTCKGKYWASGKIIIW